jgi:hypothetical protein
MIQLTITAPGHHEVYEGQGAQDVGEQLLRRHSTHLGPVPWEDQLDDGWTFPRFVTAEELQQWAARTAGVSVGQVDLREI